MSEERGAVAVSLGGVPQGFVHTREPVSERGLVHKIFHAFYGKHGGKSSARLSHLHGIYAVESQMCNLSSAGVPSMFVESK